MKYSNDFDFFLNNQIAISTTNNNKCITIFSRLDGEVFLKKDTASEVTDQQVKEMSYKIFCNIKGIEKGYPKEIKYNLHKDNSPIWQIVNNENELNKCIKQLKSEEYNPIILRN